MSAASEPVDRITCTVIPDRSAHEKCEVAETVESSEDGRFQTVDVNVRDGEPVQGDPHPAPPRRKGSRDDDLKLVAFDSEALDPRTTDRMVQVVDRAGAAMVLTFKAGIIPVVKR